MLVPRAPLVPGGYSRGPLRWGTHLMSAVWQELSTARAVSFWYFTSVKATGFIQILIKVGCSPVIPLSLVKFPTGSTGPKEFITTLFTRSEEAPFSCYLWFKISVEFGSLGLGTSSEISVISSDYDWIPETPFMISISLRHFRKSNLSDFLPCPSQ